MVNARRVISEEIAAPKTSPAPRLVPVLGHLGLATSSWYLPSRDDNLRNRPGPAPKAIPDKVVEAVVRVATDNPWYGCKKIAATCRPAGKAVTDREAFVVMRDHRLLQELPNHAAELYQAARLFELFPLRPNDLWLMDVA